LHLLRGCSIAYNAEDKIMLACKLLLTINSNNNNNGKKKNTIDTATTATSIASNFDSDGGNYDDGYLFYRALRMAYDQSEDVRKYFNNNPSRISPKNKSLWPLCYQAYKQFGI
jgi:hypothetical protein